MGIFDWLFGKKKKDTHRFYASEEYFKIMEELELDDGFERYFEHKKKWTPGFIDPKRYYSHAIAEILINRPKRRISILTSDDYILSSDEYNKIKNSRSINYVFLFANDLQSNGEHKKAIYLYEGIIRLLTVWKAFIKNTEIREKLIVDGKELPGNFLIDKGEVFDDADKNTEFHFIPIYGIYFNMGTSYNTLKFHEEAKEAFEDAKLNYKGSDSMIHHHLGCTKIFLRDFTSCIEDFNNAITTDSNYYDSYYMRAVAYASDECEFQDINRAIKDLKTFLKYAPDDLAGKKLLTALQNI